jgi:hypothetical protein
MLNNQVFTMIEDVLEADRKSWNAEHENHEANKPVSYTEVDLSALTDYYSNLQVD